MIILEKMRSTYNPTLSSRKKPAPQLADEKTISFMHSPLLKYEFLTSRTGSTLRELRNQEINQILDFFITNCKQSPNQKEECKIMICMGSPGTGKTSVIKQAIVELENQIKKTNKPNFDVNMVRFIFLNANVCKKSDQIIKQLLKLELKDPKARFQNKIITIHKNQNKILNILFIQQIEKIVEANNEASLKQLFFIEENKNKLLQKNQNKNKKGKTEINQRYIIIGTSNTINVDQMIQKKMGQTLNMNIRVFKPYSVDSKLKIFRGRIEQVKKILGIQIIIPDKLIKFIIMKLLQNKKDDIRSMIEVIKQIILIAQQNKEVSQKLQNGQNAVFEICLQNLQSNEKIKGMLGDSKVGLIQKLNFKQQLLISSIYKYLKQHEALDIMYTQMMEQFKKMQKQLSINSQQEIGIVLEQLQTYGLLQLRNKSKSKIMSKNEKPTSKVSIILKVSGRDIQNALSKNPLLSKQFQPK